MGGTWLVRGAAALVLAVLVGAWAVGVAGHGDDDPRPPTGDHTSPPSPDSSVAPADDHSIAPDKEKPPRVREAAETPDASTEPSPVTDEEPADEAPTTPVPTTPEPTPDDPAYDPPDPPDPPASSNPPGQPDDECTELLGMLDCVLNPITAQP